MQTADQLAMMDLGFDSDELESVAVNNFQDENNYALSGGMGYSGKETAKDFVGPPSPGGMQDQNAPGDWYKDTKNQMLIGLGALALILLIMAMRKD